MCLYRTAGLNVGKDVRTAETINRLLRITDHKQAGGFVAPVQMTEDPILQGIGVLKFINQRHRILFSNTLSENIVGIPLQRLIKITQQVIKREYAEPLLEHAVPLIQLLKPLMKQNFPQRQTPLKVSITKIK